MTVNKSFPNSVPAIKKRIIFVGMMKMCRTLLPFLLLCTLCRTVSAQTPAISDSSLRETLTRAVQHWKAGKAKDAYLALDTITGHPISPEVAGTKIKAAIWTANYLQAQYKIKSAAPFLDSALHWAEAYNTGEELSRAYEAYADWHMAAGNPKTALIAKESAWKIRDSLHQVSLRAEIDSLHKVINGLQQDQVTVIETKTSEADNVSEQAAGLKKWMYGMGGIIAILLLIVFLMNGTIQRLRNTPPAPAPSAPRIRPETPAPAKISDTEPAEKPNVAAPPVETPKAAAPSTATRDIVLKLQDVELVLIRAESLGQHANGETKAIRNFLNEYMAQLPFIMKTLDDAITKNEAAPILLSLEHLKTYLQTFGMQGTLKLIAEIEEEAPKEKVSKLLSRVFQVRNHCRRAADEAKSMLEKL